MVQWVGYGVGFARLLVFSFFFTCKSRFFLENPTKERVRVLDRGFFLLCLPSFVKLCANYVYEKWWNKFYLDLFLIFFFYVLCEEEEGWET